MAKRRFGRVRKLPSGRYQARYQTGSSVRAGHRGQGIPAAARDPGDGGRGRADQATRAAATVPSRWPPDRSYWADGQPARRPGPAAVPPAVCRLRQHLGRCRLPCQPRRLPGQLPAQRPAIRSPRRSPRLCLRPLPRRPGGLAGWPVTALTGRPAGLRRGPGQLAAVEAAMLVLDAVTADLAAQPAASRLRPQARRRQANCARSWQRTSAAPQSVSGMIDALVCSPGKPAPPSRCGAMGKRKPGTIFG
jgi:hypothetical protein